MNDSVFRWLNYFCAGVFTLAFIFLVIPALLQDFDIIGAFAAGFVNPFASGYSTDVIVCWAVLAIWVRFEAVRYSVRHGWVCLLLGIVPGVAVGFALYLVLRQHQLTVRGSDQT